MVATDLHADMIGKADFFGHNDEYTCLLLNDKFVQRSPGMVVSSSTADDDVKEVAISEQAIQERYKRVKQVDEACKTALEAESDFQDVVDAVETQQMMLMQGEDILAALKCVGVRGVARWGAGVLKGKGVVLLTKRGEHKNLRFAVEESAASFHGKESWTSVKSGFQTVYEGKSDYLAKHTQQLTFSTAYGVSIHGGVVGSLVDSAELQVSFGGVAEQKINIPTSCCGFWWRGCRCAAALYTCTCCCNCGEEQETAYWDGRTDSKLPKDVAGYCTNRFGQAFPKATYTFPGQQQIMGDENKMYQIKKLRKLIFQYEGVGLQWQFCEIWADPAEPAPKVIEFATQLDLLVTHGRVAADALPGLCEAKPNAAQIMNDLPGFRAGQADAGLGALCARRGKCIIM